MKRINKIVWQIGTLVSAILILSAGCRTIPQYTRLSPIALPDAFPGNQDTTAYDGMPWKKMFSDTLLQTLIDTALTSSWDVLSAFQRVEIARSNVERVVSRLQPSVSATVSGGLDRYTGNRDKDPSSLPNGIPTSALFAGLQSSWELDVWKKIKDRKKASMQRFLASKQGLLWLKTMMVSEISRRYYRLLKLDRQIAIVQKNIGLQRAASDVIAVQKEAGRATELAVRQFEAQLINTQSLEVDYRRQIRETENELNTLIGRFTQPIKRADSLSNSKFLNAPAVGIPARTLLRRPDVRQSQYELYGSEYEVSAARKDFFPTVTITPYAGLNSYAISGLIDPTSLVFGAIGGLAAPVFNRRLIKGNFRISAANARQSFYKYQQVLIRSYNEVAENLYRISKFKQLLQFKKRQTRALENVVLTSTDLYLAGYASYLEVILAQANVLEAELDEIDAAFEVDQSVIDLYHSLGGGWK